MNNFKKYPLFYGILSVLILLFIVGAGYDFYLYTSKLSDAEKAMNRSKSSFKRALGDAPTEDQIKVSADNIKRLDEKLDFLIKDLSRASASIVKKCPYTEGYQLVEGIRGIVNRWKQTCKSKGITFPEDMDFSFKRYYQPGADPAAKEAIDPLWKQICVLDYAIGKLLNSKPSDMEMGILSVQREMLPSEGLKRDSKGRVVRSNDGETFQIEPMVSARVKGSIDTLAYKFVFTGQTEVLRLLLNQLKSFDAMLVVRSVEVKPYEASSMSLDEGEAVIADIPSGEVPESTVGDSVEDIAAIMGVGASSTVAVPDQAPAPEAEAPAQTATAAAEENNTPIVTNNTSEFTVVIEYLEVIKEMPQQKANAEKKSESEEE